MATFKSGILTALTAFALLFATTSAILAQSPESFGLIPQNTLPGSSGYAFKRLKEKATVLFKFSKESKNLYRKVLLEKRVSEYVSVIEKKDQSQISNASQRIAFEAGVLAENSINESKDKKTEIAGLFNKYKPILEKMRDNFPANTPFWLLSQQDIDTLNILTEKLK